MRAPARRFTAVCDVPPPAGIAPKKPPADVGDAVASSSRFARGRRLVRSPRTRAPAAIVSVKLISAMPTAAGQLCSGETDGPELRELRAGPAGRCRPLATPEACNPNSPIAAMPAATAIERRRRSRREVLEGEDEDARSRPMPTASVSQEVSGKCRTIASRSRKKPALSIVDAEDLRDLVDDDHEADARLESDQDRIGDEVRDEAEPQQGRARAIAADDDAERRGRARIRAAGSASGATSPSGAPGEIAIVVVVLTLSGRDVPSTA